MQQSRRHGLIAESHAGTRRPNLRTEVAACAQGATVEQRAPVARH